ncbi:helix-turn-helix domain-containing protein [Cytobacillus sp. Hz8]|uniref:helix-turn-helix domain-containing protein n=1 Tax=Cytobacillus sp. Hz8 TaxID=3347168 RepID=UPI0035D7A2F9
MNGSNKKQTGDVKMKKNLLGNYLRNLREQHGITQPVLAEQLEISNAFINYIELGKRTPSVETLEKFSKFFKVDLDHLRDLLEKQKLLNKQVKGEATPVELPEPVQKLNELLLKMDQPLLDELISSFMNQVNEHLIKMTPNYSLTDLREKYQKVLSFENNQEKSAVLEGFLKLPEDNQLFFKFNRVEDSLKLELLQSDRGKIDLFEKWIGPHVFSNLCNLTVPQVLEPQRGVSFCWFSPSITIQNQYQYLLNQNLDIDSVLLNSSQLAWFIQQNYEDPEIEYDAG